jgi:hypothetical protein
MAQVVEYLAGAEFKDLSANPRTTKKKQKQK